MGSHRQGRSPSHFFLCRPQASQLLRIPYRFGLTPPPARPPRDVVVSSVPAWWKPSFMPLLGTEQESWAEGVLDRARYSVSIQRHHSRADIYQQLAPTFSFKYIRTGEPKRRTSGELRAGSASLGSVLLWVQFFSFRSPLSTLQPLPSPLSPLELSFLPPSAASLLCLRPRGRDGRG